MPLGEFVLREACRADGGVGCGDGLLPDGFVTWVNVSGKQLSAGGRRARWSRRTLAASRAVAPSASGSR